MKHTVIVHPKRFYAFTTAAILFIALTITFLVGFASDRSSSAASASSARTVIVREGDTVWSMALPLAKASNRDVRDVVRDIYRINNLSSSGIHPGQKLRIPLN
ncbi:LysM peptidoglycan-binding domain-containing protein [Murdochiella sp. Marseille-P8839]|nr:LysM peptidoglycan-binding domain-containing protein [Murdochiella sp. Marseille-P8839]